MKLLQAWKSLLVAIVVIIIMFIVASIFDIVVAAIRPRFYTTAAFIVIFGVAGIFAALFAYSYGMSFAPQKNEFARWSIAITIIITGLLFFFFLSVLEGGEYEAAFRSYGVTLALAALFFAREKID